MRTPSLPRLALGTGLVFFAFGALFGSAWLATTSPSMLWPGAFLAIGSWVFLLGRAIRVLAPHADDVFVDDRASLRQTLHGSKPRKPAP